MTTSSTQPFELHLTPHGRLIPWGEAESSWEKKLAKATAEGEVTGLTFLAEQVPPPSVHASCFYWREVMAFWMADLCRWPEGQALDREVLVEPNREKLERLSERIPPIAGAEYQNPAVLLEMWRRWMEGVIEESGGDLSAFLHRHAPTWTRVGRITLHLAENKEDGECPFAFMATYASGLNRRGGLLRQPLSHAMKEFAGKGQRQELVKLLAPLTRATSSCAFMKELVDSGDIFHPMVWTAEEAHLFLQRLPEYEQAGLLVQIPNWWQKRPRPRVSVSIDAAKGTTFGAEALLDFNVGLSLGDQKLSPAEIRELLKAEEGLIRLRGQWVEVDRDKLTEALEHWEAVKQGYGEGLSFIEGMRLLAGADGGGSEASLFEDERSWSRVVAGKQLAQALEHLREPGQIKGRQPGPLKGILRPYQLEGLNWLWTCSQLGLGACLADDMGLGKTIQILSLLLRHKASGKGKVQPSLLVVPASLLNNWLHEAARFAPSLSVEPLHPGVAEGERWAELKASEGASLGKVDLAITTYGMLQRMDWMGDLPWTFQILDEAQAIKNPSSRQTKAVKKVKARFRVALTGTPVENRLGDLWSLFDFINPGLLGNTKRFKEFCKSLNRDEHIDYRPLRRLVSPYILRRMKTDPGVADDLPEKTEVNCPCTLSKKQASLYRKAVRELTQALAQQEEEESSSMKRRGLVLKYLMAFKQICNHPGQYLGDGSFAPQDSGKFERLGLLCEEIASRGERALIFTQFKEIMDPLDEFLAEIFGRPGLQLHGGTSVKKRQALVEAFQREDGAPYFLLSLKAGGTGLNLTAATHVIHFDRWWNPAVENQATDRAFRIGQQNKVMVHPFVTLGTLEEKIDRLLKEKQEMADALLKGGDEPSFSEMSDEAILNMVSLDLETVMT